MALENQRYGRDKATLVNKTYIESGEYKRKFDSVSDNKEVNKTLYESAKTALKHRSGTKFEDMYWIDGDTGKIVAKEVNNKEEQKVVYSHKTKKIVESYIENQLIALHTHPASMPPSAADFNSCYRNKYKYGCIACHNGKVFAYSSNQQVSDELFDLYRGEYIKRGFSEYDAQIKAIEELKRNHDIDFWEVT